MSLEFDGVRAARGNSVDIGVRRAEAAVVGLRHFSNYDTPLWIKPHD
jgi:hypothetical protein